MPLPVNQVALGKPNNQLYNKQLLDALKAHLIPPVVRDVHVFGIRCVFDFISYGDAVRQLAARRRAIEKKFLESEEVIYFLLRFILFLLRNHNCFYCLRNFLQMNMRNLTQIKSCTITFNNFHLYTLTFRHG